MQDNAAAPPPVSNVKSRLIEMGFSSSLVHKKIDENGIHKGVEMDEMIDFLVAAQLDEKYAEDSQKNGTDTNGEEDDVVLPAEVPIALSHALCSYFLVLTFISCFTSRFPVNYRLTKLHSCWKWDSLVKKSQRLLRS